MAKMGILPGGRCRLVAKLSADDIGVVNIPAIVTNGAPSALVEDLDSALVWGAATDETN